MDEIHGLALCSGIGGFDLALKRLFGDAYRTVCHVEREAFSASCLVAGMEKGVLDQALIWDDIETFDGAAWRGKVDIVTAGFPCQPFSSASRGRKRARNLWPNVFEVIKQVQPCWVFCENVQQDPIKKASEDLVSLGYSTTYNTYCPSELGSPSTRQRWWSLACFDCNSESGRFVYEEMALLPPAIFTPSWGQDVSWFLGKSNGVSRRMDRLRALGNSVSPVDAIVAFYCLVEQLQRKLFEALKHG